MDITEAVYSRLQRLSYPIVHDKLHNTIMDMVHFQVKNLSELSMLKKMMLIDRIVARYIESMAREFDPVGVNAALTIGEKLVQSSLGAKHTAGLRRGATGFDRVEEVSNMKNKSDIVKMITTPINGVPRSREEINELANVIIRISLQDLKDRFEIMRAREGTGDILTRLPSWYRVQVATRAIGVSLLSPLWIRIYLKPNLLYRHRISLPAIVSNLQEELGERGVILYPPSTIGSFIDVHMISDRTEEEYMLRLGTIMALQVGGIPSVSNAHAIFENLLTNLNILEVNPNEYEVVSAAPEYIPSYAWGSMLQAMVPGIQLVGTTGKRFISNHSLAQLKRMILEVPLMYADVTDTIVRSEGNITVTFKEELANEFPYLQYANLERVTFTSQEEADQFLLNTMVEFHLFWYIEATCSHVQDLFVLPEVDPTRTFTTSPLDAMASLGYLAMRNMIYQAFIDNVSVNPTHVKTIINNMTLYKEPVSIKRQSLKNDRSEFMTYTTFEDILKYITAAAFAGEIDHMQSVSSHVLTGQEISIGRGGSNLPPVSPQNPTGNKFVALKLQQATQQAQQQRRTRRPRQ